MDAYEQEFGVLVSLTAMGDTLRRMGLTRKGGAPAAGGLPSRRSSRGTRGVQGGHVDARRVKPRDVREMTEEEKKQLAESKDMQQTLKDQMQKSMEQLEERMKDPATTDEQRRQMQEMAQRMAQAIEEMKEEQTPEQICAGWLRRIRQKLRWRHLPRGKHFQTINGTN